MKNKIICLILIISMCIGVYLLNYKKEENEFVYIAMGDFITSIDGSYSDMYASNNKVDIYNKFLSRKSMTSNDLLRMLSIDVSIVYNGVNKSISSVIKHSNMVTISVGYNDVMNNVRYNSISNEHIYDEDVILRSISLLQENLFNIIDIIYLYNKNIDIYVLSIYYPYPRKENKENYLYDRVNESIEDACDDGKAIYIDISGVSDVMYIDEGNVIPNVTGNEFIYAALRQKI